MRYNKLLQRGLMAVLLGAPAAAWSEQIVLVDGSRINGEVLSMRNDAYQVKTPSLGIINLPKSQVQSISAGSSAPAASPSADTQKQSAVQSLQATMAQDAGLMSSIMSLQNDPDMLAVLNDPEVMRLVQSFDLQALATHPKIKKLMENRQVQSIQDKVN